MFAFVFPRSGFPERRHDGCLRRFCRSARLSTRPLALSVTTSGEWWPRGRQRLFPKP